jgi:hypothetical protein
MSRRIRTRQRDLRETGSSLDYISVHRLSQRQTVIAPR